MIYGTAQAMVWRLGQLFSRLVKLDDSVNGKLYCIYCQILNCLRSFIYFTKLRIGWYLLGHHVDITSGLELTEYPIIFGFWNPKNYFQKIKKGFNKVKILKNPFMSIIWRLSACVLCFQITKNGLRESRTFDFRKSAHFWRVFFGCLQLGYFLKLHGLS
jgi:hypothetical protein